LGFASYLLFEFYQKKSDNEIHVMITLCADPFEDQDGNPTEVLSMRQEEIFWGKKELLIKEIKEIESEFKWESNVENLQVSPKKEINDEFTADKTITYSILQQRPLPSEINVSYLEQYLSAEDFKIVFKMDRESFKKLPSWKRLMLKKQYKLF